MNFKDRRDYKFKERRAIIEYIISTRRFNEVKGRALWQDMEKDQICDRSWQSMKEHFRRKIVYMLHNFKISKEDRFALLNGAGLEYSRKKRVPFEEYNYFIRDFSSSEDESSRVGKKKKIIRDTDEEEEDDDVIICEQSTSPKYRKKSEESMNNEDANNESECPITASRVEVILDELECDEKNDKEVDDLNETSNDCGLNKNDGAEESLIKESDIKLSESMLMEKNQAGANVADDTNVKNPKKSVVKKVQKPQEESEKSTELFTEEDQILLLEFLRDNLSYLRKDNVYNVLVLYLKTYKKNIDPKVLKNDFLNEYIPNLKKKGLIPKCEIQKFYCVMLDQPDCIETLDVNDEDSNSKYSDFETRSIDFLSDDLFESSFERRIDNLKDIRLTKSFDNTDELEMKEEFLDGSDDGNDIKKIRRKKRFRTYERVPKKLTTDENEKEKPNENRSAEMTSKIDGNETEKIDNETARIKTETISEQKENNQSVMEIVKRKRRKNKRLSLRFHTEDMIDNDFEFEIDNRRLISRQLRTYSRHQSENCFNQRKYNQKNDNKEIYEKPTDNQSINNQNNDQNEPVPEKDVIDVQNQLDGCLETVQPNEEVQPQVGTESRSKSTKRTRGDLTDSSENVSTEQTSHRYGTRKKIKVILDNLQQYPEDKPKNTEKTKTIQQRRDKTISENTQKRQTYRTRSKSENYTENTKKTISDKPANSQKDKRVKSDKVQESAKQTVKRNDKQIGDDQNDNKLISIETEDETSRNQSSNKRKLKTTEKSRKQPEDNRLSQDLIESYRTESPEPCALNLSKTETQSDIQIENEVEPPQRLINIYSQKNQGIKTRINNVESVFNTKQSDQSNNTNVLSFPDYVQLLTLKEIHNKISDDISTFVTNKQNSRSESGQDSLEKTLTDMFTNSINYFCNFTKDVLTKIAVEAIPQITSLGKSSETLNPQTTTPPSNIDSKNRNTQSDIPVYPQDLFQLNPSTPKDNLPSKKLGFDIDSIRIDPDSIRSCPEPIEPDLSTVREDPDAIPENPMDTDELLTVPNLETDVLSNTNINLPDFNAIQSLTDSITIRPDPITIVLDPRLDSDPITIRPDPVTISIEPVVTQTKKITVRKDLGVLTDKPDSNITIRTEPEDLTMQTDNGSDTLSADESHLTVPNQVDSETITIRPDIDPFTIRSDPDIDTITIRLDPTTIITETEVQPEPFLDLHLNRTSKGTYEVMSRSRQGKGALNVRSCEQINLLVENLNKPEGQVRVKPLSKLCKKVGGKNEDTIIILEDITPPTQNIQLTIDQIKTEPESPPSTDTDDVYFEILDEYSGQRTEQVEPVENSDEDCVIVEGPEVEVSTSFVNSEIGSKLLRIEHNYHLDQCF